MLEESNPKGKDVPPQLSLLLGDKEIRFALIERLKRASNSPKAILEELRVHNGNAIADVVAVYKDLHCYEIKSDKDSIERVEKQAKYYDLVFRKTTLVTTDKHAARAAKYTPDHWGIVVARINEGNVSFLPKRKAELSPDFNKQLALLTLWKSELTTLAEPISSSNLTKLSRKTLAELLANKLSDLRISQDISKQLIFRSQK